jgi:serine/threonine-protein kinase RsbT
MATLLQDSSIADPVILGPDFAAPGPDIAAAPPFESDVVSVASAPDIAAARQLGRALADRLGFSACDQTVIATAISELARNILQYATAGRIAMMLAEAGDRLGIVIEARDEGPGIPDLPHAVGEGPLGATAPGFGLRGVKGLMDEFAIASEVGKGTTVTVKKWKVTRELT